MEEETETTETENEESSDVIDNVVPGDEEDNNEECQEVEVLETEVPNNNQEDKWEHEISPTPKGESPYLYHATTNPRYTRLYKSIPKDYKRVYKALWASPNITLEQLAHATKMKPVEVNKILNYYANEGMVRVAQKPEANIKILVINVPSNTRFAKEAENIQKHKQQYRADIVSRA